MSYASMDYYGDFYLLRRHILGSRHGIVGHLNTLGQGCFVYFSPLQWLHGLHRKCEGLSSHTRVDISLQATHCGLETLHIAKQKRLTFPERMLQDCKKRRWLHGPRGRAQPQSPTPIIGAQYKHLALLHYVEPRILEN